MNSLPRGKREQRVTLRHCAARDHSFRSASPHDRAAFIQALRAAAMAKDDLAFTYLDEAVRAWEAQCHRSAVVMLGVASEHLVRRLAQAIVDSGKATNATRIQKLVEEVPSKTGKLLTETLAALKHVQLPGDLQDAIDERMTGVFHLVRTQRNSAGHPTGARETKPSRPMVKSRRFV